MGYSIEIKTLKEEYEKGKYIDEADAIKKLAINDGAYRIYKYSGGEHGWDSYRSIHDPSDERELKSSKYVTRVLLVYDRGVIKNVDNLWEKSPLVEKSFWGRLFSS
jgi:hypothetical protein